MAQSYSFIRETEDDLIQITAIIGQTLSQIILDTGASHTFIDFGILIQEGYRLNDSLGLVTVETANGIIYANRFIIPTFKALGITKTNFEITSYLFDDPENNYKGVIGLDFLRDSEFCIDLKKQTIKIRESINNL